MRIDIAKWLGLPPSTLNSVIVKKEAIEQADTCGMSAMKRKMDQESTYSKLENTVFP
jgi:hypothetical protein